MPPPGWRCPNKAPAPPERIPGAELYELRRLVALISEQLGRQNDTLVSMQMQINTLRGETLKLRSALVKTLLEDSTRQYADAPAKDLVFRKGL